MFNKFEKKGMTESECRAAERDYTDQKRRELEAVIDNARDKCIQNMDAPCNVGVSLCLASPVLFKETRAEQTVNLSFRWVDGPVDPSFLSPYISEIEAYLNIYSGYTVKVKSSFARVLTKKAILEKAKVMFTDKFDIPLNVGNISLLKMYGVSIYDLARCELEGEDIP